MKKKGREGGKKREEAPPCFAEKSDGARKEREENKREVERKEDELTEEKAGGMRAGAERTRSPAEIEVRRRSKESKEEAESVGMEW